MYTFGIDVGTTGISGLLADAKTGAFVRAMSLPGAPFIDTGVPFERVQSPETVMDIVGRLIDELWSPEVACVGVTGQMHGIVYLDRDGAALSPLYTWQDGRGDEPLDDGTTCAELLRGATGFGCVTDLYNERLGLIPEGTAVFCAIHDYVAARLCGRKSPLTHISDAASFGCFDVETACFTIANPRLPQITDRFEPVGEFRGVPVCVAIGDNQASFIGSCSPDADLLVNVGTGSQVSLRSASPVAPGGLEARPLDGKSFIHVGSALCGGRAFRLAVDFAAACAALYTGSRPQDPYAAVDALLEGAGTTDLVFDTRFAGTRRDPSVRASLSNISENNLTPADFFAACLNGMARELKDMLPPDLRPRRIVGSGNGLRLNPALRRIVSDVFGAVLLIPAVREEAAYGAALTALIAAGLADESAVGGFIKYEKET